MTEPSQWFTSSSGFLDTSAGSRLCKESASTTIEPRQDGSTTKYVCVRDREIQCVLYADPEVRIESERKRRRSGRGFVTEGRKLRDDLKGVERF